MLRSLILLSFVCFNASVLSQIKDLKLKSQRDYMRGPAFYGNTLQLEI